MKPTHLFLVPAPLQFSFNEEIERRRNDGWTPFIVLPGVVDMLAPLTKEAGAVVTLRVAFKAERNAVAPLVSKVREKGCRLIGLPYREAGADGGTIPLDEMWAAYTIEYTKEPKKKDAGREERRPHGVSFAEMMQNMDFDGRTRVRMTGGFVEVSVYVPAFERIKLIEDDFVETVRGGRKRKHEEELTSIEVTQCLMPDDALKESFPKTCPALSEIESTTQLLEAFGYANGHVVKRKKRSLEL